MLAGLVYLGDLSNCERDESDEMATVQLDEETVGKAHPIMYIYMYVSCCLYHRCEDPITDGHSFFGHNNHDDDIY